MSAFRTLPTLSVLALFALSAPARSGQLIACDSGNHLYELNVLTGAKTSIGMISANASTSAGLARDDATGTIWLTTTGNDSVFTLDLATGNATLVGFYGDTTLVMHGIEWDSATHTLYGGSNGNLYVIDTATGLATLVGVSGLTSFTNLGYVPATDHLYATNSSTDSFYSVDPATGAMTLIAPLGAGVSNPNGLAWDRDHGVMYMIDNTQAALYTVDLATGAATLIGSTGPGNLLGLVYIPDSTSGTSFCSGDGSGTACPCGNFGNAGNGCASSVSAAGANLAVAGLASIATDTLVLHGSSMPNSSALYFQGTTQIAAGAGVAFGDGLRCAGGSIVRLATKTNAGGASQFPSGADPSVSVRGQCAPGDVRTYQVWYRNAAAFCTPSTFNLTNGLSVAWTP